MAGSAFQDVCILVEPVVEASPRAVVVTNVWSSYYLSACLAAKRLGIPNFLAAHGGVQLLPPGIEKLFVMDHVLYESGLQRSIYEGAGVPDEKLIPCRGLIAENEYETQKLSPGRPITNGVCWRCWIRLAWGPTWFRSLA